MKPKFFMYLMLLTANLAQARNEDMLRTPPTVCSSVVDINTPGDPHDLITARRVILNQMTQQAILGRYATRAYNLTAPSDIFKQDYLLENIFYGFEVDSDSGVISLLATTDKVAGTIRPGDGSQYWLSIGDDTSPEKVICQ